MNYTPAEDKAAMDRLAADMDALKPGAAGEFPPAVPAAHNGVEGELLSEGTPPSDYDRRLKAMTDTINPGYTVEQREDGWWLLGKGIGTGIGSYTTPAAASIARQAATLAYLAGWSAGVAAAREALR